MNHLRISTLLLLGCSASNENPELLTFNGQEPRSILGILYFEDPFFFAAGQEIPLEVEASDPDGDPVETWFAYQPPGLCFDPSGSEGVWEVPEDYEVDMVSFDLVLADDSDPRGITSVELFFMNENPSEEFWEEWGLDTAE